MSQNGNFGKQPNETDIDQLTRVIEELNEAFKRVNKITDELSQTTLRELTVRATRLIELEKKKEAALQKTNDTLAIVARRELSRLNVMDKEAKNLAIERKERNAAAQERFREKQELQRQHAEDVRSHILLRKQMKNSNDALKFFTTSLSKGLSISAAGGMGLGKLVSAYTRASNLKESNKEIDKISDQIEKLQNQINNNPNDPNVGQWRKDLLMGQKKLDSEISRKLGYEQGEGADTSKLLGTKGMSALEAIGDFGRKHAKGILIGAAGAGILISIIKKAMDVSPVFQSMKKLMEFGFMLILRPIGDFFGFVMRPVMIMLLRKFIIPFYQYLYPKLMKIGTALGGEIADRIEKLSKGDLLGAIFGWKEGEPILANVTSAFTSLAVLVGTGGTVALALLAFQKILKTGTSLIAKILGLPDPYAKQQEPPTNQNPRNTQNPPNTQEPPTNKNPTPTNTNNPPNKNVMPSSGTSKSSPINNTSAYAKTLLNKSPIKPPVTTGGFVSTGSSTTQGGVFMGTGTTSTSNKTLVTGKYSLNSVIKNAQKYVERFLESAKKAKKPIADVVNSLKGYIKGNVSLKGAIGGSGEGLAFMLAPFLDYVPYMPELKQYVGEIMSPLRMSKEQGQLIDKAIGTPFASAVDAFQQYNPINYLFDILKGKPLGTHSGISTNAVGGIITEPVMGIGKSGKRYLMGEAGNEYIVPANRMNNMNGGVTVNINISNMSGSMQDVNRLRDVILRVMQESSSKMVR